MLSSISKLAPKEKPEGNVNKEEESSDGEYKWNCEFCKEENFVNCNPAEIPKTNTVDYIIAAAPPTTGKASESESVTVFCIDISGSMCTTYPVPGKLDLKGKKNSVIANDDPDRNFNQLLPNERAGITYVSRLQCIQVLFYLQTEDFLIFKRRQ
jgi:hypothetical protein